MAVAYAAKVVDRGGNGWALRNAKLRMSRKLIFASGLLLAYEVCLNPPDDVIDPFGESPAKGTQPLIQKLFSLVGTPPLEVVARAMRQWKANGAAVRAVFESYDQFLGVLDDRRMRERLNSLNYEEAVRSGAFREVRGLGRTFQDGLDGLFLDGPKESTDLTRRYALF